MISNTRGVNTRHMVSFTKNAENRPDTATMDASSMSGSVRVL